MRTLTSEELGTYADAYDLTPELAERDYVACRAAYAISSDAALMSAIALKGGFVLRHGYDSPRASVDIDATIGRRRDDVDPRRVQRVVLNQCADLRVRFEPRQPRVGRDSLDFGSIQYVGPLGDGFFGLEMSFREDLLRPPRQLTIDRFGIPAFTVRALALNEMIAEKWRCLMQRSPRRPGDPYDLWFLWTVVRVRSPIDPDDEITAAEVRALTNQKIRRPPDSEAVLTAAVDGYRGGWNAAIGDVLPFDAPPFGALREAVIQAARTWTDWIR